MRTFVETIERSPHGPRRTRTALALLAAATLLTGACSNASADTNSTIHQCYDHPQPRQLNPDSPPMPAKGSKNSAKYDEWKKIIQLRAKASQPKPLNLQYQTNNERFKGDPSVSSTVKERLTDGNVMLTQTNTWSSGFVTTDRQGRQIVVTAAHSIAGAEKNPGAISILDHQGESASAVRGCYMFERGGAFVDLGLASADQVPTPPPDIDVAVLYLDKKLHATSLPLAASQPGRGSWLTFVNNQGDYRPDAPAMYNGIVAFKNPSNVGNQAITGLDAFKHNEGGKDAYTLQPGGSGGLVANPKTGQVTDISVNSSYTTQEISETDMWRDYRIHFSDGISPDTPVMPAVAGLVDAPTIRTAIAALGSPVPGQ